MPDVRDPGAFSCALAGVRGNEALVDCGVHRAIRGDLAGARQSLEQSVAGGQDGARGPTVALWLGEVAARQGRWDAAEEAYRTALTSGAGSTTSRDAAIGLAWIRLERGNWAGALEALAEGVPAAARGSSDADIVRFLEGVAFVLGDRPVDAVAALDAVEAGRLPGGLGVEVPFWLGVALGRSGDRPRALAALDRFVAGSSPEHFLRAAAVLQAAWLALDSGLPHEAVRRLQPIDSTGARPEVRSYLRAAMARAQLEIGDARRVRETVQQLVAASPGDRRAASALLLVADAAVRLDRTSDGVALYREVLRLPLDASIEDYARYRLGEALERDGRLAEARQEYSHLRDGGRDEATAQRAGYRLGLLALRAADPAAARREGEALLRAGTVTDLREVVLLLSAEGAAREGDASRAAALFQAALRDYPDSPRAAWSRLGLGWARLSDGDPELALQEWRHVLQGSDPDTRSLAALGVAEAALRVRREAEALDALRAVSADSLPSSLRETVVLDRGILAALAGAEEEAVRILGPLAPS
ncbi:MAG TPA: tetratricopeptide repeat protein, partial [Myxococcaceae bacterium]